MTDKSCKQFIEEMRDAGFDFTFTATNGELVVKGECKNGVIKSARQVSPDEHKKRIAERLL